ICSGVRSQLTIPPGLAFGKEEKDTVFHIYSNTQLLLLMPCTFISFHLNVDWKLSKLEYLKKEFERHGYPANDMHHESMVEDIINKEDEDEEGLISFREVSFKHNEL
uniref:FKBP prolyl isomerase 14 n=1 Tax=Esox lucius TaxID=8010 RepID=A0A6Q2YMU0_ESOLU